MEGVPFFFSKFVQRMSLFVAQSIGRQAVEFTSAFGEAAEVHGRRAPIASEAYDPEQSLRLRRSSTGIPALPTVKTACSQRGIVPH
jgi:hypothetical protein